MNKRVLSLILVLATVISFSAISAFAAPIMYGDTVVVDDGAGLVSQIAEEGNDIVTVTVTLKGKVNLIGFIYVLGYDAAEVAPYNKATGNAMGNVKTTEIAPYYEILATTEMKGYTVGPNTIDNARAEGKYISLGYSNTTGVDLSVASGAELPLLKICFKKQPGATVDAETFNYIKTPLPVTVSTLAYDDTVVVQQLIGTGTVRAEAFTKTFKPLQTKTLSSIAVTTPPTKTTYTEGDTLDTTGMAVTASYSDTTSAVAAGYTCSPTTLSNVGTQKVTVSYTEGGATKTATFDVTVNPAPEALTETGRIRASATDTTSNTPFDGMVISSSAEGFKQNDSNDFTIGTEMTLRAAPVDGKIFRYWKNVPSNRIVSSDENYRFKVGSDTYLTAVYSEPEEGLLVEFIDKNGKVLQSSYLAKNAEIVKPTEPFSVGYTFTGWNPTVPATITENCVFNAQYTVQAPDYNIILSGPASIVGGNNSPYAFNQKVTVTLNSGDIPAGQKFTCWKRDGKVISYAESYSFYVWDGTTITAVCEPTSTEVVTVPQIMMDSVKVIGSRIIFMSERTVPEGYELIETGILLKSGSGAPGSLKLVGGSYTLKAVAQSSDANGQFSIRKDDATGAWYARAYVIYKVGNDIKVIYSNIVNDTVI